MNPNDSIDPTAEPSDAVSDAEFQTLVRQALAETGGTMLFAMTVGPETAREHVAAASVGDGTERQFLVISMPEGGGELRTEPASSSANPVARIAEAYAGLAEAFDKAA